MPTDSSWIEPEVFLEHAGVTIYHVYRNGDMNQGRRDYCFTTTPLCGEDECNCADDQEDLNFEYVEKCQRAFNVRDLGYREGSVPDAIKKAIDDGRLNQRGINFENAAYNGPGKDP